MKKNYRSIAIAVFATMLLIIVVAWMAGAFRNKVEPGLVTQQSYDNSSTLLVTKEPQAVVESVPATVAAKQTTLISSRVLARIISIAVRSGDSVLKDQLLIELEQKDLKARAEQTQERINAIKARLVEATANLKRAEQLISEGSIAAFELDNIRATHDTLTAELAAAELSFQEAQTAVSYTEIRSPIDGRVVDRFAEPGNTATPGTTLLSIYNPLSLRVESQVREHLALSLAVGQRLSVEIPSLNKVFDAEIEEIVPAASQNSRSFLVKTRASYDSALKPGMYARLLIPNGEEQIISVPKNYLETVGQLNIVWVLDSGIVQKRFVKTGKTIGEDNQVEIIAGLVEGENLVIPPY